MGKLDFTKMHGCGNDYVYIDCFKQDVEAPELLARTLSDRHKGVGGDGVILLCPSETADAKMRMFNADEKWRDADYLLDYSGASTARVSATSAASCCATASIWRRTA